MNIQQNEEADSKLIGVEDGDYGGIGGTGETNNGSEANGLVHSKPSGTCPSGMEINGFTLFKNRALFLKNIELHMHLFFLY
ncbi:hypothetical protein [Lysinibacillus xylanilyticus]|uniref:Uncharacterized protein n=1 Tax=Lysinibacillus xylanilyticus TaxID=582475 RepID=A0ABT4ESN5_9BACI|nr:hypothetical protein [Lysinibacillus xylanilyticus]MCY9547204.1 hypothetical protein [Lysinibacillus xylanilyticus]